MVECVAGGSNELISLARRMLKVGGQDPQGGTGIGQIARNSASVCYELINVSASARKDGRCVTNIDQRLGDRITVLVIEQRSQPVSDNDQPSNEFGGAIEHLL